MALLDACAASLLLCRSLMTTCATAPRPTAPTYVGQMQCLCWLGSIITHQSTKHSTRCF